jgi:hypothetical protein
VVRPAGAPVRSAGVRRFYGESALQGESAVGRARSSHRA